MSNLKVYKFYELYEMNSGISSKPEQSGHGTAFVSFKTVFNNYFLPEEIKDLMNTSEKEQKIYSVLEGDIFLTRTSETVDELGMSSVAVKDYPSATYSGFLKRLRPKQNDITYHKFMAFYLRSKLFRSSMNNNAIMTLRASLNEQIFSYLDLVLPPYEDQKKIGDLLYNLYLKIELNNRINAELEAMAKTQYEYWFLQFDFPDANGKPYKSSGGKMVYDETLKREIPEGWEVNKLGKLGNFKNGVNYDPSNPGKISCPIINVRNISNSSYFIKNEDLDVIYLNERDVRKYSVNENSIIIARSGIPGATRLISEYLPNTLYCGFAIHYDTYDIEYKNAIFFLLKSLEAQIKNGSGGTIMKNVNQAVLNDVLFVVPPKRLLTQFNDYMRNIFKKINNIEKQNQELAQLRDWLLPMLMNGQVTVGEAVEKVGMVAEGTVEYGKY